MENARHIRIFEPTAGDDFVGKREAAIKDLRTQFLKVPPVEPLFKLSSDLIASALCGRDLPDEIQKKTIAAIKKQSPSFVADGCTLEMKICAVLGLGLAVEEGAKSAEWSAADMLALGTWLASDLIAPMADQGMEALRMDLHRVGRERVQRTGIETRERSDVPDIAMPAGSAGDAANFASVAAPVLALRTNAALDREELDLLFWLFGEHSLILEQRLSNLSDVARAIVTGIELGGMMRRLPSQAHRNLVLRHVTPGQAYSLVELVEALGDDRTAIAATLSGDTLIAQSSGVFPLLAAIESGAAEGDAAGQQRSLEEWALRAMLERAATNMKLSDRRRK